MCQHVSNVYVIGKIPPNKEVDTQPLLQYNSKYGWAHMLFVKYLPRHSSCCNTRWRCMISGTCASPCIPLTITLRKFSRLAGAQRMRQYWRPAAPTDGSWSGTSHALEMSRCESSAAVCPVLFEVRLAWLLSPAYFQHVNTASPAAALPFCQSPRLAA